MEFNRCSRCGNFYVTEGHVCPKCSQKDGFEFSTFKTYIEEHKEISSLDNISEKTGITVKNLNRFLGYAGLEDYQEQLENMDNNINSGNNGITFN